MLREGASAKALAFQTQDDGTVRPGLTAQLGLQLLLLDRILDPVLVRSDIGESPDRSRQLAHEQIARLRTQEVNDVVLDSEPSAKFL